MHPHNLPASPESGTETNTNTESGALITEYHAHVYFEMTDLAGAEQMRQTLIDAIPPEGVVHKLFARLVGPHPLPMFEIDYPASIRHEVQALLEQYRAGRSVLIHPVTDDDLAAHTGGAQWLGPKLALLLDRL